MILRIFKAVWFLSVVGVMAIFMYEYASLPEMVEVQGGMQVPREGFFYGMLVLMAIVNMLIFVVLKLFANRRPEFAAWFCGQVITLNIFFIIAISYVTLFNSGENFRYERLGVIIYGSIVLVIGWAFGWPVYSLIQRFRSKPTV